MMCTSVFNLGQNGKIKRNTTFGFQCHHSEISKNLAVHWQSSCLFLERLSERHKGKYTCRISDKSFTKMSWLIPKIEKWPCMGITYISSSSYGDVVKTSISHYLSSFQSYHSRSKIIRQPQLSTHNFKGHEVWSWWVTVVVEKQSVLLNSRKFQINEVILWIQWRKFYIRKLLKAITVFFTIDSTHTWQ